MLVHIYLRDIVLFFHQKTLLHVHGSVAKFQMKRDNLCGLFNVITYSLGMGYKKVNGIFVPVN